MMDKIFYVSISVDYVFLQVISVDYVFLQVCGYSFGRLSLFSQVVRGGLKQSNLWLFTARIMHPGSRLTNPVI